MESLRNVLALARHPVKGLRQELVERAELVAGSGLRGDRAYAFMFMDDAVPSELREAPEETAPWMSKAFLAEQHDWPDLARITPTLLDGGMRLEAAGFGVVEASTREAAGRLRLAEFVSRFLEGCQPFEKARHPQRAPLRLIGNAELTCRYTDGQAGPVSVALKTSFDDLQTRLGPGVDWRSYRINVLLSGAPAWEELGWTGRKLRLGGCEVVVAKALGRCPNIDVHPETGARTASVFPRLKATYGHGLTGIRLDVVRGGELAVGDSWEALG